MVLIKLLFLPKKQKTKNKKQKTKNKKQKTKNKKQKTKNKTQKEKSLFLKLNFYCANLLNYR
jgi:uncharacterized membrane protein YgaE (UPF0421/DUF939 family)